MREFFAGEIFFGFDDKTNRQLHLAIQYPQTAPRVTPLGLSVTLVPGKERPS
jgi:hypothetical protein